MPLIYVAWIRWKGDIGEPGKPAEGAGPWANVRQDDGGSVRAWWSISKAEEWLAQWCAERPHLSGLILPKGELPMGKGRT